MLNLEPLCFLYLTIETFTNCFLDLAINVSEVFPVEVCFLPETFGRGDGGLLVRLAGLGPKLGILGEDKREFHVKLVLLARHRDGSHIFSNGCEF